MPTEHLAGVSTDLLVGWAPLAALISAFVLLMLFLAYPMARTFPDDQGDGNALVLLPSPKLPSYWRAPALVVMFALMYVVYASAHGPLSPNALYAAALSRMAAAVINAPSQVSGALANFTLGLRFLIVATMVCMAILGRGNALRRTITVLQVGWYILTMLCFDSYLPQEASVFRKLTVEENILAVLEVQPISWHERREKAEKLIDQLGLEHIRQNKGYALSGGERRRVEIARSLCINPTFILLDEPFSGIDPIAVLDLQKIISDLRASGIGILITDHNVRETLSVTDRAYIINEGRIFRSGTPEELGSDPEVRRVYLGESFSLV